MTTSNETSDILRPYRTLEKNGVDATEWTDGDFAGIKFTIVEVLFKNDKNGEPLMVFDYVLHDDVQLDKEKTELFEDELSEFILGLIIYGRMKNNVDGENNLNETRTDNPEQSG